jgi:uncharacterized protein (DUF1778 family)
MKPPAKSTNVITRVNAKQRALIQRAALLSSRTVADYIRVTMLKQAQRDVDAAAKASDTNVAVAQTD